ncbi:hypothetical protein SEND513_90 [Mycobacterium phage Send513]|uniref:Uncharacterized protein n=1 Tax=Mycobacterium phage Send513 TaxID=1034146 RepID=G1BRR8_9CAUD|nr:hypothetical protein FDI62_gp90 [Mycobacterium phage Send513]AEK07534.1 hypothetical protein SEND513_90 [Mycobacterium phage Send513]
MEVMMKGDELLRETSSQVRAFFKFANHQSSL